MQSAHAAPLLLPPPTPEAPCQGPASCSRRERRGVVPALRVTAAAAGTAREMCALAHQTVVWEVAAAVRACCRSSPRAAQAKVTGERQAGAEEGTASARPLQSVAVAAVEAALVCPLQAAVGVVMASERRAAAAAATASLPVRRCRCRPTAAEAAGHPPEEAVGGCHNPHQSRHPEAAVAAELRVARQLR